MATEKRMPQLILILLGWLVLAPAYAAPPGAPTANYEIEVLVFETQLPEYEGSELWTREDRVVDPTAIAVEGTTPSAEFAAAIAALGTDGRHRVRLHKRWSQTAESKSGGPPVQLATEDKDLKGTLKFYLSRFLHVELNVIYQPQAGAIGASTPVENIAPAFVINEQRRVRSNEINYFDHPKFGVLVRVAPVPG